MSNESLKGTGASCVALSRTASTVTRSAATLKCSLTEAKRLAVSTW